MLLQPIFIKINTLKFFCTFSKLCRKPRKINDYIVQYFTFYIVETITLYMITIFVHMVFYLVFRQRTCARVCAWAFWLEGMIKILVYGVYTITLRSYPAREILF